MANVADQRRNFRQLERFHNARQHMLASLDFYDSPDRYEPRNEYLSLVQDKLPDDWQISRNSIWFNIFPPNAKLLDQGWKIHISSTYNDAPEILSKVLTRVIEKETPMKFAVDSLILRSINSRQWVRGGSGKFITIYPESIEKCSELMEQLYLDLENTRGPYILSDKRYKDSKVIYYRYGGINPKIRMRYDGRRETVLQAPDGSEVVDMRNPYFSLPAWINDPFEDNSSKNSEEDEGMLTLKDNRYMILQAIHFSNAGGVYLALDNETGLEVIIKEARPHTDDDQKGNDARTIRENEWNVLSKLQHTGLVPRVIDFFQEWEHVYLVREFVSGQTLSNLLAPYVPSGLKDSQAYNSMMNNIKRNIEIAAKIQDAVDIIHKEGVIVGDLSASNIVINEDGNPIFIDLDGADIIGNSKGINFYTLGFSDKKRLTRFELKIEDDDYSLGCLFFWLVLPINGMLELSADTLEFLEELEHDYGLPSSIRNTIEKLLKPIDEEQVKEIPRIRYSIEGNNKKFPDFKEIVDEEVDDILKGLVKGIHHTATLDRSDRLFPSDHMRTNPLEIANGALGVAYALNQISGNVPDEYKDWIKAQKLDTENYTSGLYRGLSGIAWAFNKIGLHENAMEAIKLAKSHPLLGKASDIEYGVAGFGLTNLYFWMQTKEQKFLDEATHIGLILMESAKWDENGPYWISPDGNRFIGYARGSSGIALFFLYLHLATKDERFINIGLEALNAELSFAVPQYGGYLSFPEEPSGTIVSPYWRLGSAGICTALIRYVAITKDKQLTDTLNKILPDLKVKYTVQPNLFTGLSGLGNVLLDYHTLIGDNGTLHDVKAVARGISLFKVQRDGVIYFPGDLLYRFSSDYATGAAGIGLFLWRLKNQSQNFDFLLDELIIEVNNNSGISTVMIKL